ncbi:MAG: phytanoyl-CoA dioxygenase family protein [Gammaproteobacteria bacterium]
MLSPPALTEQHISRFQKNGYVVMRNAFSAKAMQQIKHWTKQLVEFPEEPGKHWVYYEKSWIDPSQELINRIENISPFHPGFAELSLVLKAPVGQLLGEEAVYGRRYK